MMGTSLNTSSSAAREMDMVLKSEISAHSAYDPATKPGNHGVPVPGKKQVNAKDFNDFSYLSRMISRKPLSLEKKP